MQVVCEIHRRCEGEEDSSWVGTLSKDEDHRGVNVELWENDIHRARVGLKVESALCAHDGVCSCKGELLETESSNQDEFVESIEFFQPVAREFGGSGIFSKHPLFPIILPLFANYGGKSFELALRP